MKRKPPGLGFGIRSNAADRSEPVRRRGRPKGSGKPWAAGSRWTPFALARIWAQIRHMIERGDAADIRTAARRIASRGYVEGVSGKPAILDRDKRGRLRIVKRSSPGKLWLSRQVNPGDDEDRTAKAALDSGRYVPRRNDDPTERFRVAYHDAERRRKRDPEFREQCAMWLRFEREMEGGGDPLEAFMSATRPPLR